MAKAKVLPIGKAIPLVPGKKLPGGNIFPPKGSKSQPLMPKKKGK
jgi:hypothetical protein